MIKKQKIKKRYMIRKVYTNSNANCCIVEATNPNMALYVYAKDLTSSGQKTIMNISGKPRLVTSYGAEFEAVEMREPANER